MQIDVDTRQLTGAAADVRGAAEAVGGLALPRSPDVSAVAAADAVRMLLRVVERQQGDLATCLRGTAALVETAVADYQRAEARAVR
ncbi:MAG: hypothetical protein ABI807_10390 [Sporichthyaceae bacterium]